MYWACPVGTGPWSCTRVVGRDAVAPSTGLSFWGSAIRVSRVWLLVHDTQCARQLWHWLLVKGALSRECSLYGGKPVSQNHGPGPANLATRAPSQHDGLCRAAEYDGVAFCRAGLGSRGMESVDRRDGACRARQGVPEAHPAGSGPRATGRAGSAAFPRLPDMPLPQPPASGRRCWRPWRATANATGCWASACVRG